MADLEYTTAAGTELIEVENIVNALLKKGWTPQGGIAVIAYVDSDRNGFTQVNREYFQALVRERSDN